jgi:hypothetical protein
MNRRPRMQARRHAINPLLPGKTGDTRKSERLKKWKSNDQRTVQRKKRWRACRWQVLRCEIDQRGADDTIGCPESCCQKRRQKIQSAGHLMRGILLDSLRNQVRVLAERAMFFAGWRMRVMRVPLATCRLGRRLLKRSREQASG